jgi:hypothetical protein
MTIGAAALALVVVVVLTAVIGRIVMAGVLAGVVGVATSYYLAGRRETTETIVPPSPRKLGEPLEWEFSVGPMTAEDFDAMVSRLVSEFDLRRTDHEPGATGSGETTLVLKGGNQLRARWSAKTASDVRALPVRVTASRDASGATSLSMRDGMGIALRGSFLQQRYGQLAELVRRAATDRNAILSSSTP